jgi:hypothetical protein
MSSVVICNLAAFIGTSQQAVFAACHSKLSLLGKHFIWKKGRM